MHRCLSIYVVAILFEAMFQTSHYQMLENGVNDKSTEKDLQILLLDRKIDTYFAEITPCISYPLYGEETV